MSALPVSDAFPEHVAGVIVFEAAEQLEMWRDAAPRQMTDDGYRAIAQAVEDLLVKRIRQHDLTGTQILVEPQSAWARRNGYRWTYVPTDGAA